MNPTIPSPVRIQCQVADRSSSERTAESERPKSLGDRLFQKLTNATPITSIPPASKPRTKQASIINADATTDRWRESPIAGPQRSGPDGIHTYRRGAATETLETEILGDEIVEMRKPLKGVTGCEERMVEVAGCL